MDVGCVVQEITTTQLIVLTGGSYVAFRVAIGGNTTKYTSGHYRILATRIA